MMLGTMAAAALLSAVPRFGDGGGADPGKPLRVDRVDGLLGERTGLWRSQRLWFVQRDPFLLSGFLSRPGTHRWQGEHVGKWLHASVLSMRNGNTDGRLPGSVDSVVRTLVGCQLPNGYLGTYEDAKTFYADPLDKTGWDVWTLRYNIIGLLEYHALTGDTASLGSSRRMGELLISTFGPGKLDIAEYGTRKGISSSTILESMTRLYEHTRDRRYLDFAEHVVACTERMEGHRLMSTLMSGGSIVQPGEGKAYQSMANLLGFLELYRHTGKQGYLDAVVTGWRQIRERHLLVTGGPWTRKTPYNANRECFAHADAFDPRLVDVENCCTVTWVQLNVALGSLTGEAVYFAEAEKALINQLLGHQLSDGVQWAYYTRPNEAAPAFVPTIHCCASSGPRAFEVFIAASAFRSADTLRLNHLSPATVKLDADLSDGPMEVASPFPDPGKVVVSFPKGLKRRTLLRFRIPENASVEKLRLNGARVDARADAKGYHSVSLPAGKKGVLEMEVSFSLRAMRHEVAAGKRWMAFMYGPVALARRSSKPDELGGILSSVAAAASSSDPASVLKRQPDGSFLLGGEKDGLVLEPYHRVSAMGTGPRTYFDY